MDKLTLLLVHPLARTWAILVLMMTILVVTLATSPAH
jgi:hypothetical protein